MTTNTSTAAPAASYGLLRAAEALTDWHALVMCGIAGLATFLCVALTGYIGLHSIFLSALLGLVTIVVGLIGYSAVGITLMRHAQGQKIGFVDAILQSTFTIHRFISVGLLLGLGYLGALLAALVVFLVCKIPVLGALLYAFAFPAVAVAIGLLGVGMGYVAFPLTAPAIWEGNDSFQTVARLTQIGRQRLMSVVVNMFMLSILVGFMALVVFGILFTGTSAATGLSTVVGVGPGSGGLMGMAGMLGMGRGMGGLGGMGMGGFGDAGQIAAFGFGMGLLITIGLIIPFLTFINGTCLIYLQTTRGMDFSASEQKLRDKVGDAKRKTEEMRERAAERMRQARESAAAPAAVTIAAPAPATDAAVTTYTPVTTPGRTCSQCHAALAADDVFCGECGTKNPL